MEENNVRDQYKDMTPDQLMISFTEVKMSIDDPENALRKPMLEASRAEIELLLVERGMVSPTPEMAKRLGEVYVEDLVSPQAKANYKAILDRLPTELAIANGEKPETPDTER